MPDKDKNFGGPLVLDFRKRWRHVKTIYKLKSLLSMLELCMIFYVYHSQLF